jgi:hypothetical protein
MPMSDREVIATWMEPKPQLTTRQRVSFGGWWLSLPDHRGIRRWHQPRDWGREWLQALHEVEERMTQHQRGLYVDTLSGDRCRDLWLILHASAEQKIAALASVLRAEVEGRCAE